MKQYVKNLELLNEKLKTSFVENPFDRSLLTLALQISIEKNDNETKKQILENLIRIDSVRSHLWKKLYNDETFIPF